MDKKYISNCCFKRFTSHVRTHTKGWKKILHAKGNQKKAGVAILTSDEIDFKTKTVVRDKDHDIILKRSFNNRI